LLSIFLALPVSLDAQSRLPYNLPQVREYLRVEPTDIAYSIAAGGTNVAEVTMTVKNAAGTTLASVWTYRVWLSDSSTCAALTATTASGTVTAKAASGVVVSTSTAKKDLVISSLATGVFVLEITDSAKTGFYVCSAIPGKGKADASAQLVTGSYG
jgi:hypothetical protein